MNISLNFGSLTRVKIPIIISTIFFFMGLGIAQAEDCKAIAKHLNGDYEKIQADKGFWGYFERSLALKDKSMIGMQADGKLRRAVSIFDAYCAEDKSKATVDLANQIADLLDIGRDINNKNPDSTPPLEILEAVQGLIKNLDELIARHES